MLRHNSNGAVAALAHAHVTGTYCLDIISNIRTCRCVWIRSSGRGEPSSTNRGSVSVLSSSIKPCVMNEPPVMMPPPAPPFPHIFPTPLAVRGRRFLCERDSGPRSWPLLNPPATGPEFDSPKFRIPRALFCCLTRLTCAEWGPTPADDCGRRGGRGAGPLSIARSLADPGQLPQAACATAQGTFVVRWAGVRCLATPSESRACAALCGLQVQTRRRVYGVVSNFSGHEPQQRTAPTREIRLALGSSNSRCSSQASSTTFRPPVRFG